MQEKSDVTLDRAAKPIINQVAAIIRTSQIHDPGNVAVIQAIDRLVAMLKAVHEGAETVMLEVVGEYFFINEMRVKFAMDQLVNFDFLVREYRKTGAQCPLRPSRAVPDGHAWLAVERQY